MKLDIQSCLIENGHLMRLYQLKTKSISDIDRRIILRNRHQAEKEGYSKTTINALEMQGIEGREGVSGRLVSCEFVGLQDVGRNGIKMRLYNITGFHPLSNSTVGMLTLIHNRIFSYDISLPRVAYEYFKEIFLLVWDKWDIFREGL